MGQKQSFSATTGNGLPKIAMAAALAVLPLTTMVRAADPTPQQQQQAELDKQNVKATELLKAAGAAYQQKDFSGALNRYRDFLSQFPKRPEVAAAHLGAGLAMAGALDRDYNAIIAELTPGVLADGADKGVGQYWLGVALRVTGEQQLEAARGAKPEQQGELIVKANERLTQAATQFSAAATTLEASVNPKPAADAKALAPAMEQAADARIAGAEVLNKVGKAKEAAELVKIFASDPVWSKSVQRPAALLALGNARYLQSDFAGAFSVLAQIAPFDQPAVGLNARYLLGKILQETGEKPEAVLQYDAVVKAYPLVRKAGEATLQNRETLRTKPIEQLRMEALVRLAPDYVANSALNAGLINFEFGQYADAIPKLQMFREMAGKSELAATIQLYQGVCYVQMKQPEAAATLQPLREHPKLGDQATWWLAKLQRASVDPANPDSLRNQNAAALQNLAKAIDKAKKLGETDPAAKARVGDIQLEQADTMFVLKQYKESAAVYEAIANDASNVERAQVAHERWAQALHKSGQFAASETACASFLAKYPRSMLKPSIMFWQAENSYRQGLEAARANPADANVTQLQAQAAARYQAVVDKYPEFAQASSARFGLGMALYRQGQWDKANKQFERILDADRSGDLAAASYYQADCLIQTMPTDAEDAISAARLSQQLETACTLLAAFTANPEERPEMPDALLKLGDCYQRNAAIIADNAEKAKTLQSSRETYDKLLQKYPRHPAYAQAVMDRARCIAATGDAGGAINELNRFRGEPLLAKSDIAPLALLKLSQIMVTQGRSVDAAAMLEKCRAEFEGKLAKDPKRAAWIPGLRYQHGYALKESGKVKEALALFDGVLKEFPNSPEAAEASLASIQVRKDQAVAKLDEVRRAMAGVAMDKPIDAKLLTAKEQAVKEVTDIANAFAAHADRIADKAAGSDLHIRTLRDAARSWRAVADVEVDSLRRARAEESLKKLRERLAKDPQLGKSNSVPRPAEIRVAMIPIQPAEQKAREFYNKALEANADAPACNELRLDLAQMYFDRGETDPAIAMLTAVLEKAPAADVQQVVRIKLGQAYIQKKDAANAMRLALESLNDSASPQRAAGYLIKGEALMLQKNWGEAITVLSRYRTGAAKYQNAGAVTEEGLLRLAEAYAASGNWEEARASYEYLVSKFGGSPMAAEARFGAGWALQQQKQFDRAIEAYTDVTRRSASEVAARAQMQIGLCRAEQKRWQDAVNELLLVPGSYDYADVAANASWEAARALVELNQKPQAREVLNRVLRDHPGTTWAEKAQKRLTEIQ